MCQHVASTTRLALISCLVNQPTIWREKSALPVDAVGVLQHTAGAVELGTDVLVAEVAACIVALLQAKALVGVSEGFLATLVVHAWVCFLIRRSPSFENN